MQFKRLKIVNFVSIRDMELHFEKNKAYHFIGGNDSGKSNILDAMRILCFNLPNLHVKTYVSDYAESFFIEGEDFEGNIISLTRGEESTYKLIRPDGSEEVWEKINDKVPQEIENIVNMYKDNVKDEKFNFRYAEDKILFMNTTPGENYSYFQKALGTDEINKHLKKANSLENGIEREIDTIFSKIVYEKGKLEDIPDLTEAKEYISEINSTLKQEIAKAQTIDNIFSLEDKIEKINKLNIPKEILEYNPETLINEIEKVNIIGDLIDWINKINKLSKQISVAEELDKRFSEINVQMDIVESIGKITVGIKKEEQNKVKIEKYGELDKVFSELENQIAKEKELKYSVELVSNVINIKTKIKSLDKKIGVIEEGANILKDVRDSITKFGAIENINEGLDEIREFNSKIENKTKEVDNAEKELAEFMINNNFCPVVLGRNDKRCPFESKGVEINI